MILCMYLCVYVCVGVSKRHKTYIYLVNFKHAIQYFLTLVTVLYIQSLELVHLACLKVSNLGSVSPHSQLTVPSKWHSILLFYEFDCFKLNISLSIFTLNLHLSFCVWFISLSVMSFSFMHIFTNDRFVFFLKKE
jgi:hypothetical protein